MKLLAVPGLAVEIDRCGTCHGIFFDPDELETALLHATHARAEVDRDRLTQLIEEERKTDHDTVRYVPCPDCGQLMNRKAYGARSGVVVDRCKEHGVWLDGGEMAHLVKWARAGGQEHDEATRAEEARLAAREQAAREVFSRATIEKWSSDDPRERSPSGGWTEMVDALDIVASLLLGR